MSQSDIVIRGAREHNLQNVSLSLPRNKLIVMTGVSGSGKSSLAFDTLYAEGQRRYVESLSSYARQFLGQMPKPEVDSITGLAPSISIQQKTSGRNPRSTVGTITEIHDYLRVLFARVGQGFCPQCDRPITAQTIDQILDHVSLIPKGDRFLVLAPVVSRQKGEYRDLFEDLLKQGFLRARVDGEIVHLTENLQLDRQMRHSIEVVVDRLVAGSAGRARLAEALENAVRLSGGSVVISLEDQSNRSNPETVVDRESSNTKPTPKLKPTRKKTSKSPPVDLFDTALPASSDVPGDLTDFSVTETEGVDVSPQRSSFETLYSTHYACTHCQISYEPPSPQLFSFNSPQGMCADCQGLGMRHDFDIAALIPDGAKTLNKGAIELLGPMRSVGRWRRHIYQGVAKALETDHGLIEGSLLDTPWNELPEGVQNQFLYGTGKRHITFSWKHSGGVWKHGGTFEGYVGELLDAYRKAKNPMRRRQLEKYMQVVHCRSCDGARLNRQARSVRLTTANPDWDNTILSDMQQALPELNTKRKSPKKSRLAVSSQSKRPRSLGLTEVCALSIAESAQFFHSLELDPTSSLIAEEVLKEIRGRLGFLLRCGLDYLTLDRSAPTLSGGETQRIRLAGQIGCGLVGVVYILDEPSIGLHPRDNARLLRSLLDLRDLGNTVIVVEHDEETIRAADHIVDFGPGPGVRGGEVVAQGTLEDLHAATRSLTGRFLTGRDQIAIPKTRRPGNGKFLKIVGARHNNLRNVDVQFPLGTFLCVTGVSGSGKSSIVNDILWEVLNRDVNKGLGQPGKHTRIDGLDLLDKAIDIDQSPIGRTPRSNPATYVKIFDLIRDLYSDLPDSKLRGYEPGRFSFNVAGGRCESCEGHGSNKLEMDFLADIWVTCPVCEGHRFNHETLEVRFKGKNIAEVLEMDVQQALQHFENIPKIHHLLQTLAAVGLDYLKLGQPSPTLSGGEAQRIKLARELGKRSTGGTVYLLDEPTTGLHFADIQKLLEVLHGFVDDGNTVIVVEHNLDVIKTADWIIDMGPEGGSGGGLVVAAGTPEEVARPGGKAVAESHTGRALAEVLWPGSSPSASPLDLAPAADRLEVDPGKIVIRGAAQHNLQKIDLQIPRDEMTVFCGPSGSGKSSLAMDTLYAEGQRRYVESLSSYARQFLGQMPKPKLDHISGLSPAIAIEQKNVGHTPRSTVGTVTEIYDYLRILFARLGQPYCPACQIPVETQTTDEVIEKLLAIPAGTRLLLLAPQEVVVGTSYAQLWKRLQEQGYSRVRINSKTYRLEEVPEMDRRRKHVVDIVVDRVTIDPKHRGRLAESVESALELGHGVLRIAYVRDDQDEAEWREEHFSLHFACEKCGRSFEELTPHNFTFNASLGWCPACEGLGVQLGTNLTHLLTDPQKSILEGALAIFPKVDRKTLLFRVLKAIADQHHFSLDTAFQDLTPAQQRILFYGTGERWIAVDKGGQLKFQFKGLYPALEEASRVSFVYRQRLSDLQGEVACSTCQGSRLRDDAGAVRFQGRTMQDLCDMPLGECLSVLKGIKLKAADKKIAGDLLREVVSRMSFLVDVGLEYLTLSRPLPTLSGGESQRIRLAGQIGRALTGVLYVLDEPTVGLHPRDNARLIQSLRSLKELGNTLVLVEHDREVLAQADRLYDFGPGAGRFGGTIVGSGTPKALQRQPGSLTGKFLSGKESISIPTTRRIQSVQQAKRTEGRLLDEVTLQVTPGGGWLELLGARLNNLHDVDLRIPLGTFTVVTGVSGSGKSSLVQETLAKALAKRLHRAQEQPGPYREIVGLELVNKIIQVDQQPLGNTPASNPATYTGVFDQIRELFSHLPDAKVRGYRPARFSFNRAGGRCEACEGNGQKCIEMHFLPDVWVECEVCHGQRYNSETLAVKFRGRSIADVLGMSIGQALELFENIPKIRGPLATLCAIGLDYLTLGQSAPTLSGGEAQRVKLAAELARPQTGRTLYILDEPTTGLHFDDIRKLLKVLDSLVELGNTVVVIEHNLDVIKTADWIVDMGPEAGRGGGFIVTAGTPEDVVQYVKQGANPKRSNGNSGIRHRSYTGEMLLPVLEQGIRLEREIFNRQAVVAKRDGDLEIKQIGESAQMPWESDGRDWHTVQRIGHSGKPARWEVAILTNVIESLEASGKFAPTNWNSRSIVEVAAKSKQEGWFLHALTGDEWLLKLNFHVPRSTFSQATLSHQLALTDLNELDDIQVYNRGERVKVANRKGPWQEVSISLHWLKEITTPGFKKFLQDAQQAFLKTTATESLNKEDLMPWKVLGKKWHLSRKGFPTNHRVAWDPAVLERLVELLVGAVPELKEFWGGQQTMTIGLNEKTPWATLYTKRREGVDLQLSNLGGKFSLGRIAEFGIDREVVSGKGNSQSIRIRFDQLEQLNSDFGAFLKEHAQSTLLRDRHLFS